MPTRDNLPSPWLIGLLPWVLDLLFKTNVMATFLGALLWGLVIVIYFASAQTKDAKLRRPLNVGLLVLSLLWLASWIKRLKDPSSAPELETQAALFILHGTFLVASAGMLLLLLFAALLGVSRENSLKNDTPSHMDRSAAPSLESFFKLCISSLNLAKTFWLLGCVLSLLALAVKISTIRSSWATEFRAWIFDPAVWIVYALGIFLYIADKKWSEDRRRSLFVQFGILACVALVAVGSVIVMETSHQGHFQGEFLR